MRKMTGISILPGEKFRGSGASSGLARGLVAEYAGRDITGEGMGIGAVALRTGGFTYFAEMASIRTSGNRVVKRFLLNRRMLWTFMGRPSVVLTRMSELSTSLYMSGGFMQKTLMNLKLIVRLKKLARIGTRFERTRPVASAVCEYTLGRSAVSVKCRIRRESKSPAKLYLMNEFSADFFQAAVMDERPLRTPSGWERLGRRVPMFVSPETGAGFTVSLPEISGAGRTGIYWGRERAGDVNWAGFEYEADLGTGQVMTIAYEVAFRGPEEP
jgi:hypothetical protein